MSAGTPAAEPVRVPVSTLARPDALDQLDLRVGTVIEASAGTGKTYLLEHLVLELILTGRARLEEILVVTFTERATAELLARIRAKLDEAIAESFLESTAESFLAASVEVDASLAPPSGGGGWRLDGVARQRLLAARAAFDAAAISTIHGFCQRILTEEPFFTERLLQQTQTDGRRLFSEGFRARLRDRFAVEPDFSDYLRTYLGAASSNTVERLELLLYRAFAAQQASPERAAWDAPFDEAALDALLRMLIALPCESPRMAAAFKAMKPLRQTRERLESAMAVARRCLAEGTRAPFLAHLDEATTLVAHLGVLDALPDGDPVRGELAQVARAILDHAPTLEDAIVQKFLPEIVATVQARKLDEGLFDFDDMITALAEALDAPGSAASGGTASADRTGLLSRIRARYRVALLDEAQDTSPAQWRIFRRCFLDSGGTHPLVLVGDPKQAIYSFRGADVRTFLTAADEMVARGGRHMVLSVNHRSHTEVVEACNAIFASPARAEPPLAAFGPGLPKPFFTGGVRYDHPVRSARGPLQVDGSAPAPGIILLRLEFPRTPRIGEVRATLRAGIVRAIVRLATASLGAPLSEIFVLTRTNSESTEMAEALRDAGVASALYKPDNLFQTAEAEHLRTLLAAIADPTDRVARFQAWLTPFFDLPLVELGRTPDPAPGHPAMRRLTAWHALAAERRFDRLWPAILQESGITQRLRLSPFSQRRLANYRQLIDVLVAEVGHWTKSIADLVALLGSLDAGRRLPAGSLSEGRGIQKVETEGQAVQILTIHKAKGLEADHVFVYGALRAGPGLKGKVNVLHRAGQRVLVTGVPRRITRVVQITGEAEEEDQRLMYVALTRARKHVYLPYVDHFEPTGDEAAGGAPDSKESLKEANRGESGDRDDLLLKKLTGAYRLVNRRLVHLAAANPGDFQRWFHSEACPSSAAAPQGEAAEPGPAGTASVLESLRDWRPPPELLTPWSGAHPSSAELAQPVDVTTRRGFEVTSYSRLKESAGGYVRPVGLGAGPTDSVPSQILDEAALEGADTGGPAATGLGGGVDTGLFLHALLEKVPLPPGPSLVDWSARADVRALLEAETRRWRRAPDEGILAMAMVHAALTHPLVLPAPSAEQPSALALGRASRIRREVEFVFPLAMVPRPSRPSPGWAADGRHTGFVRGVLDVLFEHRGRVYLADWKSDRLPDYAASAVADHASRNYALQARLYVLAVLRMLGIADEIGYERRFGGWVYVFLRGLAPARDAGAGAGAGAGATAIWTGRPPWQEIERWQAELPRLLITPGAGASSAGRER